LNALSNACNQKSNREPAMQLEEGEIQKALNHLESQSLVRSIAESRATKFEHRLQDAFNFYRPEVAIICELLLRGPQTPEELRTRPPAMHPSKALKRGPPALNRRGNRDPPLVTVLPRQPGTKEARYAHLLGEASPLAAGGGKTAGEEESPEERSSTRSGRGEIMALREEVAQLRGEVASLHQQFADFRKQFE